MGKTDARKAFERVVLKGKPPQGATVADFDGLTTREARLERLAANTSAWTHDFARRPADKIPHGATFINRLDWINRPDGDAATDSTPTAHYWSGFDEGAA